MAALRLQMQTPERFLFHQYSTIFYVFVNNVHKNSELVHIYLIKILL